ncbi:MAG TPA: hypothetical protein VJV23_04890 [Candidatus Polarisedimenticolia bacterium]|nr:hypothetical protein [Candidatus Polarisedimenticolia bacterium]
MLRSTAAAVAVAAALFLLPASCAARAAGTGQDSGKKGLRDAGEGFKELGRKVGKAGREAGQETARAARTLWYKGKKVSRPLLEEVQGRTRAFWARVIEGKDRALEQLRRENQELKKKLAGEETPP